MNDNDTMALEELRRLPFDVSDLAALWDEMDGTVTVPIETAARGEPS